ncbi:MAG: 16S rRNA (guanine(966)-N(2))-methyltransferase RsmD [Clostridia bacterium]
MRIISGIRRGTQLFAPQGMDTRPTQDRVKESLFNILQGYVADAVVLDLFAGSGGLALEAISRGAKHAALVDMDREAMNCIRRNVNKLGFENSVSLFQCQWRQALLQIKQAGLCFDLVFLDPPYRMTDLQTFCGELSQNRLLVHGAMLVLEHRSGLIPTLGKEFMLVNERRYGDSEIHFYQFEEEAKGEPLL